MVNKHVNLKGIVTASAVIVTLALQVFAQDADVPAADTRDEAALLAALATSDPAEALKIDRQLQALWRKSGSASMDLLLKRGRDALEVENFSVAIEHLTALTDHAPNFAEGWHARASAFFNANRYGMAIDDLSRALSLNPNNYNAIFGLGAILETLGYTDEAYDAYEHAQSIHPHHEEVSNALERLKTEVEGSAL